MLSVSKMDRIAAVAPMLNAAIQQMDEGDLHKSMGIEKFDDELFKVIDTAGLMDKNRVYQVEKVAVHPDNREEDMIVPVSAHSFEWLRTASQRRSGKHSPAQSLPTSREMSGARKM